jgi:hypothetical protein
MDGIGIDTGDEQRQEKHYQVCCHLKILPTKPANPWGRRPAPRPRPARPFVRILEPCRPTTCDTSLCKGTRRSGSNLVPAANVTFSRRLNRALLAG